jgi:hypothetical protein
MSMNQTMRKENISYSPRALGQHFHIYPDENFTYNYPDIIEQAPMTPDKRKAAIAAYKERKTVGGIYAVFCRPLNQRWIGRASNLSTIQNRLWFTLRQGSSVHTSLQAAWNAHGAEAFTLQIIEQIDEEALAFVRERIFAERLAHWCAVHGAEAI